jgi:hypothetical protein
MLTLLGVVGLGEPFHFVADAYYAAGSRLLRYNTVRVTPF